MKFPIGYRTVKTAFGTMLSIFLAQLFQLENFASSGILTILCIQKTKKRSISSSMYRIIACLIGIVFSFIIFEGIGYSPWTVGLLLILFIPTTVMLKITEGIVTSTVIIFHFYEKQSFSIAFILNELGIIVIGIGIALIMNLYMPSVENRLSSLKKQIEKNFIIIFEQLILYLRTGESNWLGQEIMETSTIIQEARILALEDIENHFLTHEDKYYRYFQMREKQFEIIERILPLVSSIQLVVQQSQLIADFLVPFLDLIQSKSTGEKSLVRLYELMKTLRETDLPETREEFEARAALLHFLKEMEQYLILKMTYTKELSEKKK